jgi:hypothetical protein
VNNPTEPLTDETVWGEPPAGMTREIYDGHEPFWQGYISYMSGIQSPDIPEECPFPRGSTERAQWFDGQEAAFLEVQECCS